MIALLKRIAEGVETPKVAENMGNMGNSPIIPKERAKKGSPKLDFAIQYLKDNPDFIDRSGPWLADNVAMPGGATMDRKTWSTAKKAIRMENDDGD